jgi:hypothetical protein
MREETGEIALAEQGVVGVVNLVVGKGPAEPDRLFAVVLASVCRAVLPARPVDDRFVVRLALVPGMVMSGIGFPLLRCAGRHACFW